MFFHHIYSLFIQPFTHLINTFLYIGIMHQRVGIEPTSKNSYNKYRQHIVTWIVHTYVHLFTKTLHNQFDSTFLFILSRKLIPCPSIVYEDLTQLFTKACLVAFVNYVHGNSLFYFSMRDLKTI